MLNGLDCLIRDDFTILKGRRIGLVCNQATVAKDYRHILEILPRDQGFELKAIFGPQHGLFGHTQDNMIEWEGEPDPRFGVPIYSLYGERRKPTPAMLSEIDRLVIDIQDVGSRYYTFVWTMCLCIEACGELGIPVIVLDRANPIGGVEMEGTMLDPKYSSFVGHHSVLTRHGLTAGEIALHFAGQSKVDVVRVEGWSRSRYLDETDLPWAMPSPNMPTIETAVVYPGGCFLEATNMSEGRGTTRPFETVGAPWLDGWKYAKALNDLGLHGVRFRPIQFQPTFNKYEGRVCEGVFVHVTDREEFAPVLTHVAIMQEAIRQTEFVDSGSVSKLERFEPNSGEMSLNGFAWKQPPYEYVYDRMPIDLLTGNDWLAQSIVDLTPLNQIWERMESERCLWKDIHESSCIYR